MILVVSGPQLHLLTELLARSDHAESAAFLRDVDKRAGAAGASASLTIGRSTVETDRSAGLRRLAALKLWEAEESQGGASAGDARNWADRLKRVKSELSTAEADEIIGMMVEKALDISILCAFLSKDDRPEFLSEIAAAIADNAEDWAKRLEPVSPEEQAS